MNCCIYKCHNISLLRDHKGTSMAKEALGSVNFLESYKNLSVQLDELNIIESNKWL